MTRQDRATLKGYFTTGSTILESEMADLADSFDLTYRYNVLDEGADPTGATDSTTAFTAAHDAAVTNGGYVYIPPGTYLVGQISKTTYAPWIGAGADLVTLNMASGISGEGPWLMFAGTIGSDVALGADTTIRSHTLTVADTTGWAEGDLLIIGEDVAWTSDRATEYIGQMVEILSVDSGTVVTLKEPILHDFTAASNGHVRKVTPLSSIVWKGITLNNPNPLAGHVKQLRFRYCRDMYIEYTARNSDSVGLELSNCWRGYARVDAEDFADDTTNFRYGYGVAAERCTSHFVFDINVSRVRHGFTTDGAQNEYSGPNDLIVRGVGRACTSEPFDTHDPGWNITFDNCQAIGNKGAGFQLRSRDTRISGGQSLYNATGLRIGWNAGKSALVDGLEIGFTHRNTAATDPLTSTSDHGSAIRVERNTEQVVVQNCFIHDITHSVVRFGSGGVGSHTGFVFRNNHIRNYATAGDGTERAVMRIHAPVHALRCYGNVVEAGSGTTKYFFEGNNWPSGTDNQAWNNSVDSDLTALFASSAIGGVRVWDHKVEGRAVSYLYTATFSTTPTIDASLAEVWKVTLTGNVTSSTISNGVSGQTLRIMLVQDGTGSRTFVWPSNVKWQGGGSAPTLQTAAAAVDLFEFYFDGTNWYQVR